MATYSARAHGPMVQVTLRRVPSSGESSASPGKVLIIDSEANAAIGHHARWTTDLVNALAGRDVTVITAQEQPMSTGVVSYLWVSPSDDWYQAAIRQALSVEPHPSEILFPSGDEALVAVFNARRNLKRSGAKVRLLLFRFDRQEAGRGRMAFGAKATIAGASPTYRFRHLCSHDAWRALATSSTPFGDPAGQRSQRPRAARACRAGRSTAGARPQCG